MPGIRRVPPQPRSRGFPAEGGLGQPFEGWSTGDLLPLSLLFAARFDGLIIPPHAAQRLQRDSPAHDLAHVHNAPVLKDAVESQTHRFLRQRALQTEGVLVHAISGIEDHVHMAVTIPPTLNIAEWIGKLKGSSSHFINHEICNRKTLDWQNGYGVVSFGTKDFPWVVEYIRNQKQHHRRGTTQGRLERIEYDEHAAEGGEAR